MIHERNKQYYQDNRDEILEKQKQYRQDNPERVHEIQKQYRQNNCEEVHERNKQYYQDNREKLLERNKQYYQNNRDKILEKNCIRHQNIISEFCEQYDGDLEQILEYIPSQWQVREAQMRIWFDKSYFDGMIAKMKANPVCEITGRKDNLVIHHLDSFNTHPEKGADLDNLVRVASDIHDEFHNIYGRGNNTREQWFEFLEKNRNIYI